MRLAYIISAYRYPAQLVRLVNRLMADFADFFIHVDKKTPSEIVREMQSGLAKFPNVHFLDQHVCHYCGYGHVEASLKGLRRIVESPAKSNYAILLTGQDYPIKTNDEIAAFFERAGGRSFMQFVPLSDPLLAQVWPDALERFTHWRVQGRHRAFVLPPSEVYLRPLLSPVSGPIGFALKHLLPPRKPLSGFPGYAGSSYWNLSRECVAYADEFVKTHSRFVRFFKYTRIPDEHFFQTMLLNSPLRETIVNDNLRYVDWEGSTGSSPRTLGMSDLGKLAASPALFARKFDESVDTQILDAIDSTLLTRSTALPDERA